LLRNLEHSGERNRALYVLKSRGMAHSNQVREFVLSSKGITLLDVYTGGGVVLTGAARLAQEASEAAEAKARRQQVEHLEREMERKRRASKAQIGVLQAQLEAELEELKQKLEQEVLREAASARGRKRIARKRMADVETDGETRAREDRKIPA
jgi:circadian clock protein KaiC